jgi:hypothetical protein
MLGIEPGRPPRRPEDDPVTTIQLDVPRTLLVDHLPPIATRDETERRADEDRLGSLLARAADLDLDDAQGWARLRADAHAVTMKLAVYGRLSWGLHVCHEDPPVVVARTIANAWRAVSVA